jgi:hypothetical protein
LRINIFIDREIQILLSKTYFFRWEYSNLAQQKQEISKSYSAKTRNSKSYSTKKRNEKSYSTKRIDEERLFVLII